MELAILPRKSDPKVHRPIHVSERSLVHTFDADQYYLLSPVLTVNRSLQLLKQMDKFMSMKLSVSLRPNVIKALNEVYQERQEDWQVSGEYPPVAELTMHWACHFINSLDRNVPDPAVGASPSGEVSFDWYDGKDHILSVGIQPDGTMNYAYASGNDRAHASRSLEKGFPDSLLGMLATFKPEQPVNAGR